MHSISNLNEERSGNTNALPINVECVSLRFPSRPMPSVSNLNEQERSGQLHQCVAKK